MNDRSSVNARMFFGIFVLALGVAWLFDNLGMIDASQIVRWWPAVALAWGLLVLAGIGVRRQVVPGLFWTIFGGAFLLNSLDMLNVSFFDLWPLFLIVIGGSIVARGMRGQPMTSSGEDVGATFNTFAFMAGTERKVVSTAFRRGDISVVMAGAVVDFRSATLADNRAEIDVFALWGGIEVIVPVGWKVIGEVSPILGGFEDTTAPSDDSLAPTLVVKGTAIMGGVDVKHDYGRRDAMIRRKAQEIQAGEQR